MTDRGTCFPFVMKILHVLNGDATAYPFASAGLPGDVAIWREMLSEGPLLAVPKSDEELWSLRRNWLASQFGEQNANDVPYEVKVVAEFAHICRYTEYDEVIFWFEHDLFCQINLVFLLACFARVDLGKTVLKQVAIDRFDGLPNFKGLGQLSGAQLATLYPLAEPLTAHELALAARVWPAYADSDIGELTRLLAQDFGRLRFLRAALVAQLARLEVDPAALPLLEQQLLSLVQEAPKTYRQVVGEWLMNDRIYGLGDWSIENHLTALVQKGLIRDTNGVLVET